MERAKLDAMLLLAGIEPIAVHAIANQYWPDVEPYHDVRRNNPWWLVLTKAGPIIIGWRKNVIEIDWTQTSVREIVTADTVTKGNNHVHAWWYDKAISYLASIACKLNALNTDQST